MFRILGFLIGSATSIIIILLIVGMPKFHLTDQEASQQRYDAALEKLKAKQDEIASVTGKLSEDVARVAESVQTGFDTAAEPQETPVPEDPVGAPEHTDEELAASAGTGVAAETWPADMEPHWYSFWNPFRSEIAASGFVSQLERVTGIDYRVVKVKSGVYEVAFAYTSDTERQTKLSQISAATGLDLPDS